MTSPDAPPDDRPTEAVERIITHLRAGLGELRCVGSERLVRRGVSMSHLHVMSMLDRHGEMAMSRIADLLDVSFSNATGLIDRMEERGLVERVRVADDRRVVLVRVTDAGREILAEVEVLRNDILVRILDRLNPAQLNRVLHAVEDLRAAIAAVVSADPAVFNHDHAQGAGHHALADRSATVAAASPEGRI
jgi:DNA-binding MarR family transcriptional regulator